MFIVPLSIIYHIMHSYFFKVRPNTNSFYTQIYILKGDDIRGENI